MMLSEARRQALASELYGKHRNSVYRRCLLLCGGDRSWAEDVTHDVFIRLLERLPSLEDPDDLGGWIHRVTMNTCMTRLKRDRSIWARVKTALMGEVNAGSNAAPATPEARVQVSQELKGAWQELEQLPAQDRVVFTMRHLEGMKQRDIATALHLSEGYVSKILKRTTSQLRARGWETSDE